MSFPERAERLESVRASALRNMVAVPGGTSLMGSEDFYPEERPVRDVEVDEFWIDAHPVTAGEYRRFVHETGYVTVAERPLDPADYPDADPDLLVPGSLVFRKTAGPVPLDDPRHWWEYVRERPGSGRAAGVQRSTGGTAIRWSRSPTKTPRPTPRGRERSSRPRRSGNARHGAVSRALPSPGVTSSFRTGSRWRTHGRGSSPGRT